MLSFLNPVWLSFEESKVTPFLEVVMYKGRLQLATKDALYSDGDQYTPALSIINDDPGFLANLKNVLILGVGLGSMVQIIRKRGYNPLFTLVELDKVILKLAMEVLQEDTEANLDPHSADAEDFMKTHNGRYDLIFIDIFNSRTVPDFVSTETFLTSCKRCLNTGGKVAFNYIMNDPEKWAVTQQNFANVFPVQHIINNDINRILIGKG